MLLKSSSRSLSPSRALITVQWEINSFKRDNSHWTLLLVSVLIIFMVQILLNNHEMKDKLCFDATIERQNILLIFLFSILYISTAYTGFASITFLKKKSN